jgi:uncharacterized protein YceK
MKYLFPSILLTSLLTGCASISSGTLQTVGVSTETASGVDITQANCTLKNEKGTWNTTTLNNVTVHKAAGDLLVECNKQGYPKGTLRAISRAGAGLAGNLLFGGPIGAVIDHSNGAAYYYPIDLSVVMGKSIVVDVSYEKLLETPLSN